MNLRNATSADIPFIMELERASASAAHWTEERYREGCEKTGRSERLVLVAEEVDNLPGQAELARPMLIGFLVARQISPEWELENIVVAEGARRRGTGAKLLSAFLARAREDHSARVFLEVRESNIAARKLYEKAGFRESGRRKMYYSDPPEDAILCSYNVV